jgi:hypothetical protein
VTKRCGAYNYSLCTFLPPQYTVMSPPTPLSMPLCPNESVSSQKHKHTPARASLLATYSYLYIYQISTFKSRLYASRSAWSKKSLPARMYEGWKTSLNTAVPTIGSLPGLLLPPRLESTSYYGEQFNVRWVNSIIVNALHCWISHKGRLQWLWPRPDTHGTLTRRRQNAKRIRDR